VPGGDEKERKDFSMHGWRKERKETRTDRGSKTLRHGKIRKVTRKEGKFDLREFLSSSGMGKGRDEQKERKRPQGTRADREKGAHALDFRRKELGEEAARGST